METVSVAHAVTPIRIELHETAAARFAQVAEACARSGDGRIAIVPAYSVKTNPKASMLRMALDAGFHVEVIGAAEAAWVRALGFRSERIVYNGPEPAPGDGGAFDLCFADSIEAFERNCERDVARTPGVRLRPAMIESRFGVAVADDARLAEVARRRPREPLSVSMHVRREDYGGASWLDLCVHLIERAQRLEASAGRRIAAFDVGGGWEPAQFDQCFERDVRGLLAILPSALPAVTRVVVEPGQAVATGSEALRTTVLEVRRRPGRAEAIVDAGYNDWPQLHAFEHRLFVDRCGTWVPLAKGPDRIGGRTCLEYDRLDGVALPADLEVGDVLMIGDVGGYDSSMSFRFGRGT